MFKILTLLFSFLVGQFRGQHEKPFSYEELINVFFRQLNGVLRSLALGATGMILSASGFLMAYFNLLGQYDMNGGLYLSAVTAGGTVLFLIGAGLLYSASRSMSAKSTAAVRPTVPEIKSPAASPLEDALATLVVDYIKEREHQREMKRKPSEGPAAGADPLRARGTVASFSTEGTGVLN
jgi:hypothetical protein